MRGLVLAAAVLLLAAPAAAAPPSGIDARAYFVQDAATGEVLAERNARARVPIASITKLMTALLVVERGGLHETVVVPPFAATIGESSVNLRAGERITRRDLLRALLIQSANDAAFALAGDVDAFVRAMNAKARQLGLRDTHFTRPDGLDAPEHLSSARDATILARVAMRKPEIRAIVDDRTATIEGGRRLHTWNDLLGRFPGLVGVKTGHTAAAGWSQVAAVQRRGFILYATLLGSPERGERNRDLEALLRWALAQYGSVRVIDDERTYARADVGYGRAPVALVAPSRFVRPVRVNRPLVERVVAPTFVRLPVRRGQRLGSVSVYSGTRLVGESPLVAARAVERPGFLSRAWWTLRNLP